MEYIAATFRYRSILLTGATTFLGSVALEQLIRVFGNDITRCYVLLRGQSAASAQERLSHLLASDLFSVVREQRKEALRKVEAVDGDLTQPGLGLSEKDTQRLAEVSVVIHCAAKIRLFDTIHDLLNANYIATRNLLDFTVARLPHVVAFVHTSSISVGFGLPSGSMLEEVVYPLHLNDAPVDDARLASELLSMEPHAADVAANHLVRCWGLRVPYALTKRLAELLVQRYHEQGLPCAIVRPSNIVAVAGAPRPGYTGGYTMYASLVAAYVNGFYSPDAFAVRPDCVQDTVPCDVAAGVVLGAAMTLAAGVRSRRQLQGVILRGPVAAQLKTSGYGGDEEDDNCCANDAGSMLVFHAATSAVQPLRVATFVDRMHRFFTVHKPQRAWPTPGLNARNHVRMDPRYVPDPELVSEARRDARKRVARTTAMLKLFGRVAEANKLVTSLHAWQNLNNADLDGNLLISVRNTLQLERLLCVRPPQWSSGGAAVVVPSRAPAAGGNNARTAKGLSPRKGGSPAKGCKGHARDDGGDKDTVAVKDGDDGSSMAEPEQQQQQQHSCPPPRPLLPVVWRDDWGPLLDAFMADVVQRLMRVKLVPPPPHPTAHQTKPMAFR